ncbi:ATP-dependent protease ATPase subunit HslU [Eubacteriales bacterium OttesenSCG-928-M02]|nr:ATP-dependent protease ATPase subunit HslU [Eubacteriales bacterium OttesenSCG-928-M02]
MVIERREDELTPAEIVQELDKYIIGQGEAKRAVAVALRNRYRRSMLDPEMQGEITPKNILMMGPTGVGKTEIARRLAKLVKAPFIKVEATKFTEVGYVGRDVESMIRDLTEAAIRIVKDEWHEKVSAKAAEAAEDRLIDLLMPADMRQDQPEGEGGSIPFANIFGGSVPKKRQMTDEEKGQYESTQSSIRFQLQSGLLEDQMVEVEVEESQQGANLSSMGLDMNMGDILGPLMPKKKKLRRMKVSEARRVLEAEEADRLIDMDEVTREALIRTENHGIVFIDEIDKIAGRQATSGPDVSREGVQRDILPIVEGSTVMTKYGPVKTDYMLFIAAGAFHVAKVEDLIPELQGRFPVVVTLDSLTAEDFGRILVEPDNAITKQYAALLSVEGTEISFTEDGIAAIAEYAYNVNLTSENLGARRLHTIIENLLNPELFEADGTPRQVTVDRAFVTGRLKDEFDPETLKRYIL